MKDKQNHNGVDEASSSHKKIKMEAAECGEVYMSPTAAYMLAKKTRESISHRIIEKRRRDRINRCLGELSRLVPATACKKGKLEKTEILQQAVEHLKQLQARQDILQSGMTVGKTYGYRAGDMSTEVPKVDVVLNPVQNGDSQSYGQENYNHLQHQQNGVTQTGQQQIDRCNTTLQSPPPMTQHSKDVSTTFPNSSGNGLKRSQSMGSPIDLAGRVTITESTEATKSHRQQKEAESTITNKGSTDASWKLPLKKRDCVHTEPSQTNKLDEKPSRKRKVDSEYNHCVSKAGKFVNSEKDYRSNQNSTVIVEIQKDSPKTICNIDTTESCYTDFDEAKLRDSSLVRRSPNSTSGGFAYVTSIHPVLAAGVPVFALHPSGSGFVPLTLNPQELASSIVNSTEFAPVNDMALLQQGAPIPNIPPFHSMPFQQSLSPLPVDAPHAVYGNPGFSRHLSQPHLGYEMPSSSPSMGSNSSLSSISTLSSLSSSGSYSSLKSQFPWQSPPSNRPISH